MTIMIAYSLHDVKALVYHAPVFFMNDALALRSIGELVADLNTSVGRYASDYKLYRIGMYNDADGTFEPCVLQHVIDCVALVPVKPMPLFEPKPNGSAVEA